MSEKQESDRPIYKSQKSYVRETIKKFENAAVSESERKPTKPNIARKPKYYHRKSKDHNFDVNNIKEKYRTTMHVDNVSHKNVKELRDKPNTPQPDDGNYENINFQNSISEKENNNELIFNVETKLHTSNNDYNNCFNSERENCSSDEEAKINIISNSELTLNEIRLKNKINDSSINEEKQCSCDNEINVNNDLNKNNDTRRTRRSSAASTSSFYTDFDEACNYPATNNEETDENSSSVFYIETDRVEIEKFRQNLKSETDKEEIEKFRQNVKSEILQKFRESHDIYETNYEKIMDDFGFDSSNQSHCINKDEKETFNQNLCESNDVTEIELNIGDEDFCLNKISDKYLTLYEAYNIVICKKENEMVITHIEISHKNKLNDETREENEEKPTINSSHTTLSSESFSSTSSTESENIKSIVRIKKSASGKRKTETVYDKDKNPIIERVSVMVSKQFEENVDSYECRNAFVNQKTKLNNLIDELIQTEKIYLSDLGIVCNTYYKRMKNTPFTKEIFANIGSIFKEVAKFYEDIFLSHYNYEQLGQTFLKYEYSMFSLYPKYFVKKVLSDKCINNPIVKNQMQKIQTDLKDRLDLPSYLLKPVQRLGRYILFLKQIQKELTKNNINSPSITNALEMVEKKMKLGNDEVAYNSIKNLRFTLNEMGSFLMSEKCMVLKPKKYECQLYLFDKMLIFAIPDQQSNDTFMYKNAVKVDEMGIVTFEEKPLLFHIRVFGRRKVRIIEIEALTPKSKKAWTSAIEDILWKQYYSCRESVKKTEEKS